MDPFHLLPRDLPARALFFQSQTAPYALPSSLEFTPAMVVSKCRKVLPLPSTRRRRLPNADGVRGRTTRLRSEERRVGQECSPRLRRLPRAQPPGTAPLL